MKSEAKQPLVFADDAVYAPKSVIMAHAALKLGVPYVEHIPYYDMIESGEVTMHCYFDLSDHRRRGLVVKRNTKTVVVAVVFGCRTTRKIKRHIKKHNVKFLIGR